MSKPTAIQEVNDAVFRGDITTHKEYKELERQLKQQAQALEEKDDIINKQQYIARMTGVDLKGYNLRKRDE